MAALRFLCLVLSGLVAHEVHAARPSSGAASSRVSARAGESAPVVWGAARGAGFSIDLAGATARFELDGREVSLARVRVLALGARGEAELGAELVVDLVDDRGLPVARDRAARVTVAGGKARLELLSTTWDGRPDPGAAGGRTFTFDGVTLASPSRAPGEVVEVTGDGERPVGATVAVRAEDGAVDRVDLDVRVRRGDGSELRVDAVTLDAARQGGVVVRGTTQSHGRVALAVWGTCDVTDGDGRTVAEDRPVQLYVLPGGVTQLAIDGVIRIHVRDTVVR